MQIAKSDFLDFVRLVVDGKTTKVSRLLTDSPGLATTAAPVGATRQETTSFFLVEISHYLYAGDTALHMAAAAFSHSMAKLLVAHGADCPRAAGSASLRCATSSGDGQCAPPPAADLRIRRRSIPR